MKRFLGMLPFAGICVLIGFLALLAGGLPDFAADPGVGWHLKTGEVIASQWAVPRADPFLAGAVPRKWVSDQWLSDLIFYQLYSHGGWPLLYAAVLVLYMGTFWLALYPALASYTKLRVASAIACVYAWKIAQVHFIIRPVQFSFLFFALAWAILFRWYRALVDEGTQLEMPKSVWALPLIFLFWANLHPGFVLGLLLVALLPVSLLADTVFLKRRLSRAAWKRVLTLCVLCVLATMVNPYGPLLHTSVVDLGSSGYFMSFHQEWMSPDFKKGEGQLLEFALLFIAASWLLAPPRRGETDDRAMFVWLPLLCFGHFAFQAVRMLPFFGIIAALPLVQSIKRLKEILLCLPVSRPAWLVQRFAWIESRERSSAPSAVTWYILLSVLVAGFALWAGRLPLYRGPYGPPPDKYPYSAIARLRELTHGMTSMVLADPEWGGFITWFGAPLIRPVIDDRNTMLGEEFYRRFYSTLAPDQEWNEFAKSFGAHYMLLHPRTAFAVSVRSSPFLRKVFEDDVSVLYEIRS